MGVHAALQTLVDILGKRIRRHSNNGNCLRVLPVHGPDTPRRLVPRHHRHTDIHQNSVEVPRFGCLELLHADLSVLRPFQLQAQLLRQQLAGNLPVQVVVLCQQNPPALQVAPAYHDIAVVLRVHYAHKGFQTIEEGGFEQRLGDEARHAGISGLVFNLAPVVSGDEENRDIVSPTPPDLAGGSNAVHTRQLPVQQDDVVVIPAAVVLLHHFQGGLRVLGPVRIQADSLQGRHRALAQLLVVVHHQHTPLRQHHVHLLDGGPQQVQGNMEFRSFAQPAAYLDIAAHGVNNVLCDGHAQTGTLGLLHPCGILPAEGVENLRLILLRHTDTVVLHGDMGADVVLALGGLLLIQRHRNGPAVGRELHRIAQQVDEDLIEPQAVAAHVFRGDVVDGDVELLALGPDLGLDDIHNAVHDLPQGDLIHIQGHPAALDLGHVQHVVDQAQQVFTGEGNFPQAVLHLVPIADIGGSNCRHAHDGVHRRADIMAHVGQELALGSVSVVRRFPGLLQLLNLLLGHLGVLGENQHQDYQHQGAGAEDHDRPPLGEAVDNIIQSLIGHKGEEEPLGMAQLGAEHLPCLAVDGDLRGELLVLFHSVVQIGDICLFIFAAPCRVIEAAHPFKIAVPESVAGTDDESAVLADNIGVDAVAVFLQRECVADVFHRKRRHHSDAGVVLGNRVAGGDAQQNQTLAGRIETDGHLFFPLGQGLQIRLQINDLQLGAVQHVKAPVRLKEAQVAELPGLGAFNQLRPFFLIGVDSRRGNVPRQHLQLVQPQADGGLEVGGNLLVESGHIHFAHCADRAGALVGQEQGQQRENGHAEGQHQKQAALHKTERPVRKICFSTHLHPSSPLLKARAFLEGADCGDRLVVLRFHLLHKAGGLRGWTVAQSLVEAVGDLVETGKAEILAHALDGMGGAESLLIIFLVHGAEQEGAAVIVKEFDDKFSHQAFAAQTADGIVIVSAQSGIAFL